MVSMANDTLRQLNWLVGTWATTASHPALPGVVVNGTATIEWLEGERFLIHRAHLDHPDFPDSISIIGITEHDRADKGPEPDTTDPLHMHYFDSRGVFRIYDVSIDGAVWRIWRDAPGFSQRFTGTRAENGETIDGLWQLRRDDLSWENDLKITYQRDDSYPARE
jgi:hypothetical protein